MPGFHLSLRAAVVVASVVVTTSAWPQLAPTSPSQCVLNNYTGDRIALVVGTDDYSDYQYDKLKSLDNAANDAQTVAALLTKQGFIVRCLLNPTQLDFDREKTALALYLGQRQQADEKAADSGRAVVYIAGHGYHDPDSGEDYVLFRFEKDESKYTKVVNLTTLKGKIAEGRWSVQALVQAFNTAIHGTVFMFDACRSTVEIPSAAGTMVRAGPMNQIPRDAMKGKQVVAYSTQPGGTAADGVPNDATERNGLYMSVLSHFIDQSIYSLGHVLDLTHFIVRANKPDQLPMYSVAAGTLFLSNPWINREPANACETIDSEIWNSAGRTCEQLRSRWCIEKDICPVVKPYLSGPLAAQARTCLAKHKTKWLHNDLIEICGATSVSAATDTAPQQPGSSDSIAVPTDDKLLVGPKPDKATTANAYNIIATSQLISSTADFAQLALLGWSEIASTRISDAKTSVEQLASEQLMLARELANTPDLVPAFADKNSKTLTKFVAKQRDSLLAKTETGKAPSHSTPSPFQIDLTDRVIALRSLPTANSPVIETYSGRDTNPTIDCITIPCANGWIGLRIGQGRALVRGWVPAEELRSSIQSDISVEVEYDGKRIAPSPKSAEAIRAVIRQDPSNSPARGRVQLMVTRLVTINDADSFLASARLSYLDRLLIDLGIKPDDIIKTIVEVPAGSAIPSAIVNIGGLLRPNR
jgi:hypothetical protein